MFPTQGQMLPAPAAPPMPPPVPMPPPAPLPSPLQQRGAALRNNLDEALRVGRTPLAGVAPPQQPGAPLPGGPPGAPVPPGPLGGPAPPPGAPMPLPQRVPPSPIMGALQAQQAARRPGVAPQQPMPLSRPAPPAAYAQGAGPVGFKKGGFVSLFAVRRGRKPAPKRASAAN